MSLSLDLQLACDEEPPPFDAMRGWVEAALAAAGRTTATELTVRIVDEIESAALNQAYRHKAGPTNVLSFPFESPPGMDDLPLLGDLVICAPVVRREAAGQGKREQAHWAHMLVHGTLHLLGHDHVEDAAARRMEALETAILQDLGFPDPYRDDDNP